MKEIISKYLNHEATEEELIHLNTWLEESEENKEELFRLKNAYVLTNVLSFADSITIESKSDTDHKVKKRRFSFYPFAKYAAVVCGTAILSIGYMMMKDYNQGEVLQTLTVNEGERAQLTLADGTQIWLNANTVISYPDNFNRRSRSVNLKGEAYFKVAKNKDLPFIVNAENIDVKVLGTEFNVKAYNDENTIEVQVTEGKVQVYKDDADSAYYLTANEMISFDKSNSQFTEAGFDASAENWREGKYVFNNKPLSLIIKQLERIYAVHFIVNDTRLLDEIYYGEVNVNDSITKIMEIISINGRFNYAINDKQIIIYNN